jgi:hypothetical protein
MFVSAQSSPAQKGQGACPLVYCLFTPVFFSDNASGNERGVTIMASSKQGEGKTSARPPGPRFQMKRVKRVGAVETATRRLLLPVQQVAYDLVS